MPAEPSQDARADQPTETICMFTIRGEGQELAASYIRDEVKNCAWAAYDWTQTTRVIPEVDTVESVHGPALSLRGHDFMELVRCVWYVVGRLGIIGLCWCFVEIVRRVVIQIDW